MTFCPVTARKGTNSPQACPLPLSRCGTAVTLCPATASVVQTLLQPRAGQPFMMMLLCTIPFEMRSC